MILYHGSNQEIETIDLTKCRPYKDFGRGFYLTDLPDQAQKMANRVARIYGGVPFVNRYRIDMDTLLASSLSIRKFDRPNREWAMFVMNNRNRNFAQTDSSECNSDNKYDLVIGPVADDDLALLFRQFESGLISIDILVKEMEFKRLTSQFSFHTEAALQYLHKAGVIK